MKRTVERRSVFHQELIEDLRHWVKTQRTTALRVLDLAEATLRDPFQGPGKPEPLRHMLAGCWSRRITDEHRLVYQLTPERIRILACRYHY